MGYDQVIVIAAYRRYADWLVSTYNQVTKSGCLLKKRKVLCQNIWSGFIWDLVKNKSHSASVYENIDKTLPSIREYGPSKLEVKVLNYFQLQKQ